ncbi:MAG: hypothetical protein AABM66_10730 [Actinomycetota bacterium]
MRGAVLPDLPQGSEAWFELLTDLANGPRAVLLPGSDAASEFLVARRDEIPDSLRSFEGKGSGHLALMDKASTYDLAREAGVRAPWVERVSSFEDLEATLARGTYPCVVKPVLSHVGKMTGNHRTKVAKSSDDLRARCSAALRDGVPMLVTEHVPGREDALEAAITVRAEDGTYPLVYARRKIRQWPLDVGVGSMHCSTRGEDIIASARRLLDYAGFKGISIVEMKRHADSGELVLIEANVRIPMGFGLGDAAGIDASWRLYAALAGLPLPPQPTPREGMKAVVPHIDLLAVTARMHRGELTWREAVRSYRGVREVGVLDLRDPAPALALGARIVRSRLARVVPRPARGLMTLR